jgi:hypothetical protein
MRSITITPSLPFALLLLSLLIQCTAITGVDAIFGWGKSRRSKAAVETTAAPDNGADPLNPEPISPPSPPSSSRALMTDVVVSRIIPPGSNLEETQTKSGEPGDGPIFFSGEALRVQWRWANGVPQKHVRAYLIRQGGLFKSKVKTYHFATPDDELLAAESASMDIPLPNFASSGRYYFRFIEYEITEKSSIFRSGPSKRTERYLDAHEARFRIENTMSRCKYWF